MKKNTNAEKTEPKQKADSRKQPASLEKTGRTQKTPAGERNEPVKIEGEDPAAVVRHDTGEEGVTEAEAASPENPESERAYDDSHSTGSVASSEPGGFHIKAAESRKHRQEHEKGHVEEVATHSRVPPIHMPGEPGGAPMIQQRRSVYERGNRYPLTHAPKA